jgi:GAF domain-containing protein
MPPAEEHAALLARLAAELHAEPDEKLTARTIVEKAHLLLPSADHASLTVVQRGKGRTLGSTSKLALRSDVRTDQPGLSGESPRSGALWGDASSAAFVVERRYPWPGLGSAAAGLCLMT